MFLVVLYLQILLHWKSENVVPNWKQNLGEGRPGNDKQKKMVSFGIRQTWVWIPTLLGDLYDNLQNKDQLKCQLYWVIIRIIRIQWDDTYKTIKTNALSYCKSF